MALNKTMYAPIPFSPVATLTSDIAESSTIIPVSDVNAFPPAPSYATIGTEAGAETIRYSAKTADSLSGCTRGVEGTAQAWQNGEPIARNFTAEDHQAIIDNLEQLDEELQQAYSPTNKPTASDVGALPISGGTLSGDLYLGFGYGRTFANNQQIQFEVRSAVGDTNNRRGVFIANAVRFTAENIKNAVQFYDITNGNPVFYMLYGEHNKSLLTEAKKDFPFNTSTTDTTGLLKSFYWKDATGTVYAYCSFKTKINVSSGTFIGAMPVGYRPANPTFMICNANSSSGATNYTVTINTSGNIGLYGYNGAGATIPTNTYFMCIAVYKAEQ